MGTPLRSSLYWYLLPAVVVLMTILAWGLASRMEQQDALAQFQSDSRELQQAIENRMDDHLHSLVQAAGFVALTSDLDRTKFRDYVRRMEVPRYLRGIQGVGLAVYLRRSELNAHIQNGRASGFPDFAVKPSGARDEYLSILYLEPMDRRNRAAIGYDMLSDPVRREAIIRARDTGQPSLSGKVTLVQEIEGSVQPGFLLYVPIYTPGLPLRTIAERRTAFEGTVYAPFRSHDFFNAILEKRLPSFAIQVFAGNAPNHQHLIYASATTRLSKDKPRLQKLAQASLAGQTWTFLFTERPELGVIKGANLPATILLGGILLTFLVVRLDIGNRRYLQTQENALATERRLRAKARRAIQTRDEVLAIVPHDLRNPLNNILLNSRLLRRETETPHLAATSTRIAEQIERSSVQMNRLIQDLLDVAQFESGVLKINTEHCDIVKMCKEMVETVLPMAEQKNIRLLHDLPERCEMQVDPKRVSQVLSNLLGNAIKFTASGGSVILSVKQLGTDNEVLFTVRDTGTGIPAKDLPFVFQRFWKTQDAHKRGVGLGLFIAERIVRAHGGRIWVKSELEKGTTFSFVLSSKPALDKKIA